MKKLFFSALLAAVVVGGAFASNTLIPAYTQIGSCKAANTIQTNCATTNTGIQCTATANDGSGIGVAYSTQSSPFLCAAPLKQPL